MIEAAGFDHRKSDLAVGQGPGAEFFNYIFYR